MSTETTGMKQEQIETVLYLQNAGGPITAWKPKHPSLTQEFSDEARTRSYELQCSISMLCTHRSGRLQSSLHHENTDHK